MITLFNSNDNAPIISNYQEISAEQRLFIQLLSVIFKPIALTEFKNTLEKLQPVVPKIKLLLPLVNTKFRDQLKDKGLVSIKSNNFHCMPNIVEIAIRDLAKQYDLKNVIQHCIASMPIQRSYMWQVDPFQDQKLIRDAFYTQNNQALLKLLNMKVDDWHCDQTKALQNLIDTSCKPFDLTWFNRLPENVQFCIFKSILSSQENTLTQPQSDWQFIESRLLAIKPMPNVVANLLAHQWIVRLQLDAAKTILKTNNSAQALALSGWIHLIEGNSQQALVDYQEGLKALRKETKKRNAFITGLPGIGHILALLSDGGIKQRQEAEKLLALTIKNMTGEIQRCTVAFQIYVDILNNQSPESKAEQFSQAVLGPENKPWLTLICALLRLWLGLTLDDEHLRLLAQLHQQAKNTNLLWYAHESGLILQQYENADIQNLNTDLPPLYKRVKAEEAWERTLQALQAITIPTTTTTTANASGDTRMSWRLNAGTNWINLEPREQKQGKNGQWTAGRPIALKKLYDTPEDYPYLTPQDKAICNQIREYTYQEHYRYTRTDYALSGITTLKAATNHPQLVWGDDPTLKVEVLEQEPTLLIEKTKDNFHLKLMPFPEDSDGILLKKEGNRLIITDFTPQHRMIAQLISAKGLKVPLHAKKQVLNSVSAIAPLLTVNSDITLDKSEAKSLKADQTLHLHLQPFENGLTIECFVQPCRNQGPLFHPGEGGSIVVTEIDQKPVQTKRNKEAELQQADELFKHCSLLTPDTGWYWNLPDAESALETLQQLHELGDKVIVEWPQGKKIKLSSLSDPKQINISIGKQKDWFTLEGEVQINADQVISMKELLLLIENTPGNYIKLGDDAFLSLSKALRNRLNTLQAASRNGQIHPLATPLVQEAIEGMQSKLLKNWKDQVTRFNTAQEQEINIPPTLQAELRDYQQQGFDWLARLAHWGAGACLADDMGLGKTLQALTLLLHRANIGPALVIAPTSLGYNWIHEASRFAPSLNIHHFGPGDRQAMLQNVAAFDLVICSYGLLQNEITDLAKVKWASIVADEAQAIKNSDTKRAQAAMQLQGEFKLITTGTPLENHLGELWSLFQFINPGLLGTQEQFNERFAVPIEQQGSRSARQQLKQLLRPFILRRLKTDVLDELPSRTEITLPVTLSAEETAMYEAMRQQALERMEDESIPANQRRFKILAEITRLRQLCCHPKLVLNDSPISSSKLNTLLELLPELKENGHRALIFSQFVTHLTLIRQQLDEQGISYQYLDGSTPAKQRDDAVKAFQAGEGDLFLISLKAGGTGLNLTAADYVIHMDPWWNPAVEDQASDRAHRMGQKRPVTIYRLITQNTIEEKIVQLHSRKRDLADSLLEGTDSGNKVSAEEMMDLLRGM